MDPTTFEILLNKVHQKIQRSNTIMREAIPARVKLQVTLSYLATGNSYRNLQQSFRVSRAAISKFIPEVCDAIYEALGDFIKVPSTHEEWKVIEEGFNKRWNFPGCYGAIDGKHINIRAPANCGSYYFNYKGSNSVVLMAIVDDNYCFRYVNVGCNGRFSDGGVFQNCEISKALENNLLPNGGFIVGDDAFPLKPYLFKPYSLKQLTLSEKIFNYRLSRARRIVENAFGILVGKFRVFEKPIACDVSTVDKIILACCALHNWLRITNKNYFSRGLVDEENLDEYKIIEGSWRFQSHNGLLPISNAGSNHSSQIARLLREKYTAYFMNEGSVPWQERMIF
ncbi:putative nuclease HARBI1 [Myzus persicae]|uniref:putative nuclease HARBI1 n=1 Tax=Myzus persicae TaxID=13164 RepID=UPI000B9320A8|nr:putative nuclease HARBI1 [Myzus persicae]